jgi:hypothetical protein
MGVPFDHSQRLVPADSLYRRQVHSGLNKMRDSSVAQRMPENLIWVALNWLTMGISGAYAATMTATEHEGGGCSITIEGKIERGDAARFVKGMAATKKTLTGCGSPALYLDSDGGDVDEALRLGRAIRANEMMVVVPRQSSCLSSCVFLLAAGVNRISFGKTGIHRPYFAALESGLSNQQVRVLRDSMNSAIVEYLREMDVSVALLDAMLAVSPEEMKMLGNRELTDYRIVGIDPTWDERQVAYWAAKYGMTSAEYRTRSARTLPCYSLKKGITLCHDKNFWGISERQAIDRGYIAEQRCPKDSKNRMACVKQVMLTGQ